MRLTNIFYFSILATFFGCKETHTTNNYGILSYSKSYVMTKVDKLGMTYIYEVNKGGENHGKEVLLYSNKKLSRISHYRNGKLNGRAVTFFPNVFSFDGTPSVSYIGYFKDGQRHGKLYGFNYNGILKTAVEFTDGVITGNIFYFDKSGKLNCYKQYDKKGKLKFFRCFDAKRQLYEWVE